MPKSANKGLPKVYWITVVCILSLVVLGAILWWYDYYLIKS
jgi:hypothetical protein